jgi:hypothetical protein
MRIVRGRRRGFAVIELSTSALAPVTQLTGRKYPSRASDAQGDVDRDDVRARRR